MLKINKITKIFNPNTSYEKLALDELSLDIEKGDFITVLGTNGAGKSSLLNAVAGVFRLDHGKIELEGMDLTSKKEYQRAKYIGRLFQDPMKGTAPNMTIAENLGLAYSRGMRRSLSWGIKKKDLLMFREILAKLDLGLENRLHTKVKLLSGGQRQALTLMMATIKTPKLLLLDEHTAALDPLTAQKVMKITQDIVGDNNLTTLMITHNVEQAMKYGNKTIMLDSGRVVMNIEGEARTKLTPMNLIEMYSDTVKKSISDEMLFSGGQ